VNPAGDRVMMSTRHSSGLGSSSLDATTLWNPRGPWSDTYAMMRQAEHVGVWSPCGTELHLRAVVGCLILETILYLNKADFDELIEEICVIYVDPEARRLFTRQTWHVRRFRRARAAGGGFAGGFAGGAGGTGGGGTGGGTGATRGGGVDDPSVDHRPGIDDDRPGVSKS